MVNTRIRTKKMSKEENKTTLDFDKMNGAEFGTIEVIFAGQKIEFYITANSMEYTLHNGVKMDWRIGQKANFGNSKLIKND